MSSSEHVSTGLSGLDKILDDLRIGDNVVWSVDSIDEYRKFVFPFVDRALRDHRRVVYFRFGQHEPLLDPELPITVYQLDARAGFESFAKRVHSLATEEGEGVFYIFDSLSDLLSAWATDLMIGNFFHVTCPYLFELNTVAYFALIRDRHSFKTIKHIGSTTQVLLDIHNRQGDNYILPLKVWERNSPTMFLPHLKRGDDFIPLANSYDATNLLKEIYRRGVVNPARQLDHWHRLFLQAEDLVAIQDAAEERERMVIHLCRHLVGREDRMLDLARRYFTLQDLLEIKGRMIGTGYIGGKAVGMHLARAILHQDPEFDWKGHMEEHDSFYIGSNVFYTYIVHNGWWKLLMQQKTEEGYFSAAAELRKNMLRGRFPEELREEFQKMLEYYGQYPIIVRSSSLLEDGFGNAFAGKYDSFFLTNQGSPEERYARFEDAVRRIFASTMSEDALSYRLQRGLSELDEQMALLVQRVSGAYRNHYYFPELAGVGISYNTFVWDKGMDPKAGMLRMVLGLGTRAVDRVEGDYPRIVALDAPLKQPHRGFEDTRRFSQRDVDLLDLNTDSLKTVSLLNLIAEKIDLPLNLYTVRDQETERKLEERGRKQEVRLLTFDQLLSKTEFTHLMRRLLKRLEDSYQYPVDVEFTLNFSKHGDPKINVVQCRPLQTKGEEKRVEIPESIEEERTFFRAEGNFMGGNVSLPITRVIWIDAEAYTRLSLSEKYEVARLIGRINKRIDSKEQTPTLLMGPGRWGTSTPSLGVPVTFSEISNMAALCEVAFTTGDLMPDLSFGSHFFQDLVETDIFYLALFPENKNCFFNRPWLDSLPNALEGMMPASSGFKRVVKICYFPGGGLRLLADVVTQQLVCFHP